MENQYMKTFPDLMKGKTVMYVHGFGSAASTNTVKLLQTLMPSSRVIAEDIPLHPDEAMEMLRNMAAQEKPDLIIGTSMGGMYTEMLRGYDRIVTNPAFEMADTMSEHGMIGKQTFFNPRKDGIQDFIVTKALVKEYAGMTARCFEDMTDDDTERVWGLFGDKDPLVHTFGLFRSHYPNAIRFHGEHRLTEHVIIRYMIPLIRQIDDRQEGRKRSVLYIGMDTLKDNYGKPKSNLAKCYEFLLPFYDIQFVAPAPTNDPASITEAQTWIEETFSAPAWNKVVLTNQPELLLGDYIIDTREYPDFMGTSIRFGSDNFKNWEETQTFFERLGGQ